MCVCLWVMLFSVEKERKTKNPGHWRGFVSVCFCVGGCLCVCVFRYARVCVCALKLFVPFFFLMDSAFVATPHVTLTSTHTHTL